MARIYGVTSVTNADCFNGVNEGVFLRGKTQGTGSTFLTTGGDTFEKLCNTFVIGSNTALIFDVSIGAVTTSGSAAGLWRFSGVIRRETTTYSTKLVGVTPPAVIADPQFAATYVEVYEDISIGALMISVSGTPNIELYWNANFRIKEMK